jgi:uncharacterized Ntn-hydrolase superfamily protein
LLAMVYAMPWTQSWAKTKVCEFVCAKRIKNFMNFLYSTFSIVARDSTTGQLGVAAASKFFAVGSGVSWAEPGVGAIATQAYTNVNLGRDGLAMMSKGISAQDALDQLLSQDEGRDRRQVGIVDATGEAAAFTGKDCPPHAAHLTGPGVACQGNLLRGEIVVEAMMHAYDDSREDFARRLLIALQSGQAQGGDRRGQQSAVLLIVNDHDDNQAEYGRGKLGVNLRVDDSMAPLDELERLLGLHYLYFQEPAPSELVTLDESTVSKIQVALREIGLYKGSIDSGYDKNTQDALMRFLWQENLAHRLCEGKIDRRVLLFMQEDASYRRPQA